MKSRVPSPTEPPRLGRLLLSALLPARYRDHQLGDLREAYVSRHEQHGRKAANRWYRRQVIKSISPSVAMRIRHSRSAMQLRRQHSPRRSNMGTLLQDLRYGVRSLVKYPTFAAVATVTLALAIGVNTAIFSLVNVLVFADLPMREPDTEMIFRHTNAELGVDEGDFSLLELLEYREQNTTFESINGWQDGAWVMTGGTEPVRIRGVRTTVDFFSVWRLQPFAGRGFLEGEDRPGAPLVAMLTYGFWIRQFGAREDALGSTVRLDGSEYTVVGIMPPEMDWAPLGELSVWIPLQIDRSKASRDQRDVFLSGRLLSTATVEQADREIAAIGVRLAEQFPASHRGWEPRVIPLREGLLDDEDRTIMLMLVLTVVFVLLIACANVANMLLARATTRAREMAVRTALGAGRTRLVRQLLTESFVIGIVSTGLGLALSRGLMYALIQISAGNTPVFRMATIDGNVLMFTLAICLLAPLAFGLLPALRASTEDVGAALKEGTSRAGGRKGNRTRGVLVGAQVSLALVLMIVASLFTRTVINLNTRELGYDADGVLSMRIVLPAAKYEEPEKQRQFFERMAREVEGLPGVQGVGLASFRPAVEGTVNQPFQIEGQMAAQDAERPQAQLAYVSHEFFDVLGIPLLRGRGFTQQDTDESFAVAVISQETARRYWPESDPIGLRLRIGTDETGEWAQIVGTVGNVRSDGGNERTDPQVYLAYAQKPRPGMVVMVRVLADDPLSLAPTVRQAVWAIDPDQPVDDVRTLQRALYDDSATAYALISLFVAFAAFALCMAGVGIYGVMSYMVSQRRGEISVRLALGASAGDVRMMVLRQGGRLIFIGSLAGLAGAALISQLLSSLVFGISALDPLTFAGVPAILIGIGLLANYLPARRATRIEPMRALRVE